VQEIVFNKMSFAGDDLFQVRRSWFSLCFKGQASFIFFLGLPFFIFLVANAPYLPGVYERG